ncbi:hypothetical protein MIR68_008863 [Amoeboaphelidium protococcarum]|nr:hypothetical protein MIR68_008863 [Amoeboaphelidium protococcarum]
MTSGKDIFVGQSAESIGLAAVEEIIRIQAQSIEQRGKFSIAFSGGSLPKVVGGPLIKAAERGRITREQLDKWIVLYADERFVLLDDGDSNHKLCEDQVLSQLYTRGLRSQSVLTVDEDCVKRNDLTGAAQTYQTKLQSMLGSLHPQIDLILLGMGPDGHTCSLFPGHELLKIDNRDTLIACLDDSPKPPPKRITFTLPLVNDAHNVYFIVTGDGKKDVLSHALSDGAQQDVKYPVQLVDPRRGTLVWFLDTAAASKLSSSLYKSL